MYMSYCVCGYTVVRECMSECNYSSSYLDAHVSLCILFEFLNVRAEMPVSG